GTKRGPSFALLPTSMCWPFTREVERETLGRVVMKLSSVTGTKAQLPKKLAVLTAVLAAC
ncbi:hypothetical protein N0V94_006474, partial [Neodidymelliopsis sp. IMI 364377]